MYPSSFKDLIESFKLLPGIGEKTAERMAFAVLNMEKENCLFFSQSIMNVKNKIKRCNICHGLTEDDVCYICSDLNRDKSILCVVEDPKNIFLFEKTGFFKGTYHVINSLISPLEGINPEDIGIETLIKRIEKGKYSEIILALKPSIEGETTSLYIKKILDGMNIKVTKLASGIPMGTDMEYIDNMTLERAMIERKELE